MSGDQGRVTCHYCEHPIANDDKRVASKCGTAFAHFECWYESGPFGKDRRDPVTGKLPPLTHRARLAGSSDEEY